MRTRWMLGSHRLLDRLWEKLTCFPTHGCLPQISQTYDTEETSSGTPGGYQSCDGVRDGRPGTLRILPTP